MHISSLFGDYSIGSFGSEAKYFADFLSDCGFTCWQVLPFGMTDDYNSPYKSYSAFGGNPYFVDLKILNQKGLVTDSELCDCVNKTPYVCEYERLRHERVALLMKASQRTKEREKAEEFAYENPYIEKFCEFMALKDANEGLPWWKWHTDKPDPKVLFGWKFIQHEFFNEWQEIKKHANSKGISIIGDIPMYVSLDSCDVWADKKQYLLDEQDNPVAVAGVGPDYFSKDGQLWGNPLYNWEVMKKDGYSWWCDRIRHMSKLFDAVRIDHFRAIESFWAVPSSTSGAKEGKWIKGPGKELVDAIKKAKGATWIIAEDLGDITPMVRKLVDDSGFSKMRVFQFGFLSEGDSIHKPHNYPKNSVAYTGTHDNNTLLGYLWEQDHSLRQKMLDYCSHKGSWDLGCESIMRTMYQSHADVVIMPIQDLLGFGSDTRMNTPGKAEGNWQFRITKEQLDRIDKNKFKSLNNMYSR